ncbi:MAG: trypsin-like peptidase domain-containing protein [Pseudomonadota bacterium]
MPVAPRIRRLVSALLFVAIMAAPPPLSAQRMLGRLNESITELSEQVAPAVVQILVSGYRVVPGRGSAVLVPQRGSGSGVLVDPSGYIVTNYHVIENGEIIEVALTDRTYEQEGRSIVRPPSALLAASVVGVDRETDLAVLKVQAEGLPFLPFADSDELSPGQLVFAFGSPRGLQNSISMGVISAVGRQLSPDAPMVYLQTDAAINPGNSGGPLVDLQGRVAGINTSIFTQSGGSEGIGFAAPANIVETIYERIREDGRMRRGTIGADTLTISPALARGLGLDRSYGVVIEDAFPGGPAAVAGLLPGDVVVALDGKVMENARQFDVNVYLKPIGGSVRLTVLRGGGTVELLVPVIERPDRQMSIGGGASVNEQRVERLAIFAVDLDEQTGALLPPTRRPVGVVVGALLPSATPEQTTLQSGDIIYSVNGRVVDNLEELRRELASHPPGAGLVLQVERQRRLQYLVQE